MTTFTIAHSITLIAASMQWITRPTGIVELIISISVTMGGIMIFFPIQHGYRLGFVFSFGLIHGFGFANVLHDWVVSQQTFLPAAAAMMIVTGVIWAVEHSCFC